MIYAGTSTSTSGTDDQISTSAFNSSSIDNAYVGYMYGSTGASSYSATHANNNSSTIKGILDNWYKTNIVDKGHSDKVSSEAGFCGDREPSTSTATSNGSGGTGTTETYYGAYIRLTNSSKNPTFECQNSSDLYTVASSSQGNNALDYPIGLITADEAVYAGGVSGQSNNGYYLYTNQVYWTMSPHYFYATRSTAYVFGVYSSGGIFNWPVYDTETGVRPVINLKANTKFQGSGTIDSPFEIA